MCVRGAVLPALPAADTTPTIPPPTSKAAVVLVACCDVITVAAGALLCVPLGAVAVQVAALVIAGSGGVQ